MHDPLDLEGEKSIAFYRNEYHVIVDLFYAFSELAPSFDAARSPHCALQEQEDLARIAKGRSLGGQTPCDQTMLSVTSEIHHSYQIDGVLRLKQP